VQFAQRLGSQDNKGELFKFVKLTGPKKRPIGLASSITKGLNGWAKAYIT